MKLTKVPSILCTTYDLQFQLRKEVINAYCTERSVIKTGGCTKLKVEAEAVAKANTVRIFAVAKNNNGK